MGKKHLIFWIVFLPYVLLCGQRTFDKDERWINPEGWKVPDISALIKSGEKQAAIFGHGEKIVVETYRSPKPKYSYFDKKVGLEEGRYLVYLDCEVRVETDIVHVYKDQKGKVLLYFINCMLPERVVANNQADGFHNAGYSASATQFILVDLNKDGKFESQYTETTDYWNDITLQGVPDYFRTQLERSTNSIVYNLLKIKLAGK